MGEAALRAIVNPPYSGNLHLKILSEVLKHFTDVVSLQPVRWLQDPLAEYKKSSDWKKFENVRDKIESVEVLDQATTGKTFGAGLPFNLGVYKLTKDGGFDQNTFKNKTLEKMVSHIEDTLQSHIVVDELDGISCLISLFTGGRDGGLLQTYQTGFMLPVEKAFYTNKLNDATGETYYDYRKKVAWGNIKPKATNTNVKFSTKEERQNFYDAYNTKCLRWLNGAMSVDVNVHPEFQPWLDWTKKWTDQDLYSYFGLTDEEIATIEEKK